MRSLEQMFLWFGLLVLAVALCAFAWQMAQLFIATGAMFDALEAALEARQ